MIGALLPSLAKLGARFAEISIEGEPGDRRVIARAPIAKGSVVALVPRRALITPERARASLSEHALGEAAIEVSPHSMLALWLVTERSRARSPHRYYLDGLPASHPLLPIHYPGQLLALLEGSFTRAKIERRRAALRDDHRVIRAAASDRRVPLSFEEFAWARHTVLTRVFGVRIEDQKTEALVPLADMMNHSADPAVTWAYDDAEGAFVMTAERDVAEGDEVTDSYGAKCNSRYFLSYGFAIDHNPHNLASVTARVSPRDPLADRKLARLGRPSITIEVPARLDDRSSQDVIAFLRVAVANERELASVEERGLDGGAKAIGARNEIAALGALAEAAGEALSLFPTSIEEDDAILRKKKLDPRARLCVVVRRGEKRVLARLIELAGAALPYVRLPPAQLAGAIEMDLIQDEGLRRYLIGMLAQRIEPASPR